MLADQPFRPVSGALDRTVQVPDTFCREVIEFIAQQLPYWKQRLTAAERQESEVLLTDKLRSHLNSVTRHAVGMDVLQFGTEVPDELVRGRAIDLAAKPCGVVLVIQGRAYVDFETILPVECKRLPIPKGKDRDEREYVYSAFSSTGGIQRFKAGLHASAHRLAAMIAYVQEEAPHVWERRIDGWIRGLAQNAPSEWSLEDLLHQSSNSTSDVNRLQSRHTRDANLETIALEHLWLAMN